MTALTVGSLFTGYDGIGLALDEVLPGNRRLWFSDNAAGPMKILAHRWPEVPNLGDIRLIDFASVPPVDILTGGFPCTDLSAAGRRVGMTGPDSGLWDYMLEAVYILRPRLVIIENVRGLLYAKTAGPVEFCAGCMADGERTKLLRALGAVLGDLADLGYDAEWIGLKASDVGAPHQRYRIFVTAHPAHPDSPRLQGRTGECSDSRPERAPAGRGDHAATNWGIYEPAIGRWESVLGRCAPPPTGNGERGGRGLSPRFAEWMMGLPEGHVTSGEIGLSRSEQLVAIGGGVVPQQAAAALRVLLPIALPKGPSMTQTHDLTTELVSIDSLVPHAGNPRRGNLYVITESLKHLGQYRPIVANRGNLTGRPREILAGHHLVQAATSLGWTQVAVTWVDVDDDTGKRILAMDNRSSDLAEYDDQMLADLLSSLPDLDGTGYFSADLDALTALFDSEPAIDSDQDVLDKTDEATWPFLNFQLAPDEFARWQTVEGDDDRARALRLLDGGK